MPTVTKCPNGHLYDAEMNADCPYCSGTVLPPTPPPTQKSKISWIVAGVAVLAAIFCFSNWKGAEAEMEKLEGYKKRVSELIVPFGGSQASGFYAETSVLFLDHGGKPKRLACHDKSGMKVSSALMSARLDSKDKDNVKWHAQLCRDIKMKWEGDDLVITPGQITGYNIVHIWDENSDAMYDVLIIVR